jgi:hypothetical protein
MLDLMHINLVTAWPQLKIPALITAPAQKG